MTILQQAEKTVKRIISLEEKVLPNGSIRFKITVRDDGRPPFITRWFNDITPASDFYDKLNQNGGANT